VFLGALFSRREAQSVFEPLKQRELGAVSPDVTLILGLVGRLEMHDRACVSPLTTAALHSTTGIVRSCVKPGEAKTKVPYAFTLRDSFPRLSDLVTPSLSPSPDPMPPPP